MDEPKEVLGTGTRIRTQTTRGRGWGPCSICRDPEPHPPYRDHGTFCPSCVLAVCGNCWSARLTETWSHQRRHRYKPLLMKCPSCGWQRRLGVGPGGEALVEGRKRKRKVRSWLSFLFGVSGVALCGYLLWRFIEAYLR